MKKLCRLFLLAGALAVGVRAADDQADNPAYTGINSWATGQNGGIGFGPWALVTTGSISTGGFFLATSGNASNSIGTGPNGNAWGMYANSGAQSAGFRGFTGGGLGLGQAFLLTLDTNSIDPGSSAGFSLRTGNATGSFGDVGTGQRFAFYFVGGGSNYFIDDGGGTLIDTGVGYTAAGLTVQFTLVTPDTYALQITPAGGGTTAFTRPLAGPAGNAIDSFALFNNNAGAGAGNDVYFNSVLAVPEPATWLAALGLAGCVGWTLRRRA